MKRIRSFVLTVLVAASVASASPSIGPSHFVNYVHPETFLTDAIRSAAPERTEMPSRSVLAACGVLGILIVKASRE